MKRLISLALCMVMLLTLAGCSLPLPTTETEPPTEPTEPPTQPVVEVPMDEKQTLAYEGVQLQYWSLLDREDPEADLLVQAAEMFEKTTGAVVELNWMGGDQSQLDGILAEGRADLFEISGNHLSEQYGQYAMELTSLAENSGYTENSWDGLRQQIISHWGALKAVALRPHLYGLYYNRDRFDQLSIEATPATWEDFVTFSRMLEEKGFEALAIDQERANILLELHMERALGWDGLKETMVYARWRSNEMAMTMIQSAIQFAEDGYLVKGTPDTYPKGQDRLIHSNGVLVAGSEKLCSEVESSTMMEANWGVFPYPGDGPGTGLLVDADLLAVSSNCADADAAFDFAMLLTTGEFDQLRADVTKAIPADPNNSSPILGANTCMASATAQAPKWFTADQNLLFTRLWNGWYKTGAYFADQLNKLSQNFAHEKSVG